MIVWKSSVSKTSPFWIPYNPTYKWYNSSSQMSKVLKLDSDTIWLKIAWAAISKSQNNHSRMEFKTQIRIAVKWWWSLYCIFIFIVVRNSFWLRVGQQWSVTQTDNNKNRALWYRFHHNFMVVSPNGVECVLQLAHAHAFNGRGR